MVGEYSPTSLEEFNEIEINKKLTGTKGGSMEGSVKKVEKLDFSFSKNENLFIPTEKRGMGMVYQSYALWPHMTVFENVAYPLQIRNMKKDEIRKKVLDILKLVKLNDYKFNKVITIIDELLKKDPIKPKVEIVLEKSNREKKWLTLIKKSFNNEIINYNNYINFNSVNELKTIILRFLNELIQLFKLLEYPIEFNLNSFKLIKKSIINLLYIIGFKYNTKTSLLLTKGIINKNYMHDPKKPNGSFK